MKQTKHKILSVFLSFCMIISCMVGMSLTAYAASNNITISAVQHGTVTASVNGSAATSAEDGATVTLTANPDNGYRLKSISGTYKGNPQETKGLNGTKTINGTYFNLSATDAAGAGWSLKNNSTITITSKDSSVKIDKVDFNIQFKGRSFNLNNVSCSAGTKSLNGNTLSVSSINGTTVTLSSSANNAGAVRFNSVTIYGTGAVDTNLTISTTGDVNVRTFTMPAVVQGDVTITPVFEEIPKYNVILNGGANATTSGGNTTQTGVTGAMTTVTYTANSGYHFTEFANITNNGITATRTSDTVVTVSGTPTADASITIPNAVLAHTHSFTYSADGATITAACTTGCDITEGLTMTISAPTALTYDGTAKEASLSTGYNTTAFPDTYTISYSQGTTALTSAPVDAGTYTASVTVGTATAKVEFTIAPKTVTAPTITLSPESYTYDSTAKEPTVTVADGTTTIDASEYTVSYSDNTAAGTATVTVTDKDGGNYTVSGTKTFTIGKADPTVTAPTAVSGLVYTGSALTLVSAGSTTGGTLEYSTDGQTYSTTLPTGTNAGSYTVYYRVTGNDNYNSVAAATVSVSVAKAASSAEAPTANTLTYTGSAQALVQAGTPTGGTMQYSLDGISYDAAIPTGTDAGNYTVYYKVAGDENHEDYTGESPVNVSISKATQAAPTTAVAVAETVSGKADGQITGVDNTMEYKSATGEYTAITGTEVTGLAAGDYQVRYAETDNYLASDPVTVTITTGDKLTVTFDSDGGSDVSAQELDWNGTVAKPTDPTKTGYTFKEWQLDGAAYDFNTAVTANITLKAAWTINQYTLTFNTNGGTEIAPITQDYGTAITAPAVPTKQGYHFTGWSPAIPATMPAYDLTVNAQWSSNTPVYVPTNIVTPTPVTPTETETVTPAAGTFEDITDEEDNAGEAQISTPGSELADAILTDSDRTAMASGEDVKVYLEVEEVKPTAEEEALVEEAITDAGEELEIAMYLDIDLFKKVGGNSAVQIHETNGQIEVSIDLPEGLENNDPTVERSYYVARIHNDAVDIISATYDPDTNKLTFLTDKFSVYAILFKDSAIADSDVESDTETEIEIDTDDDTDKTPVENNVDVVVETGEDTNPHTEAPLAGLAVLAMSASAAAAAFTAKKRKNK